jgi:signal transduction histidine kinase
MITFNRKPLEDPNPSGEKSKIAEVISIAAHQLRHPISVIKNYLEVLISEDFGELNPKQKEYLQDTLENVHRAAKTISHLLDISRIEEGRYELKLEPASLVEITESAIQELSLWAEASNCEIIFKKPKGPLPPVLTDTFKIRQVVENLIVNAVRYKKIGKGKVEIAIEKKGKEINFSCKDNGIGVPKKDFKKVFTKFYRSEEAMEIDPTGSGLGLYLNKATVEASGGRIWFSKNADFGMTFSFSLPIFSVSLFLSPKNY